MPSKLSARNCLADDRRKRLIVNIVSFNRLRDGQSFLYPSFCLRLHDDMERLVAGLGIFNRPGGSQRPLQVPGLGL